MASPITFAHCEVSYPPYTAEFDPYDRGYLIIGGGGGESRTGVPNRITVFDTSTRASIADVGSIDLPTTSDCVTSTASLTTPRGLRTLVCQSSGRKARTAGDNDPIKTFDIAFPQKTQAQQARRAEGEKQEVKASVKQISQSRLLSQKAVTGKYANQDPIRLSPVLTREKSTKRVGAVASKDADQNEVVLFDATKEPLDDSCVLERFQRDKDVEDLDIWDGESGHFALAFCDAQSVYVHEFDYQFSKGSYEVKDAKERYRVPSQHHRKFKGVRWIAKNYVALLSEVTQTRSSEVLIMKTDGTVTQRYTLPRSMKVCTAIDALLLDADPSTGDYQIILSVGGMDGSVHLAYSAYTPLESEHISKPKKYRHIESVHSNSVCALAFAPFFPPAQSSTSTTSVAVAHPRIKLASLGVMSNKVVVESVTLTSTPVSPFEAHKEKGRKGAPTVRWVLSTSSIEGFMSWINLLLIGLAVLGFSIAFQRYRAVGSGDVMAPLRLMPLKDYNGGGIPPAQRAERVASKASEKVDTRRTHSEGADAVREAVKMAEQAVPSRSSTDDAKVRTLRELVDEHGSQDSGPGTDNEQSGTQKIILVSPHESEDRASVAVHEAGNVAAEGAKKFKELSEHEKEVWKERLKKTGQWLESEGVAVLEGVFFSEFAADVGGAIRDAVLNN